MKVLQIVKQPDLEKERCERKLTLDKFLESYNKNLPSHFPRASISSLNSFKKANSALFKDCGDTWSLDRHRKKVMDWLPGHLKNSA